MFKDHWWGLGLQLFAALPQDRVTQTLAGIVTYGAEAIGREPCPPHHVFYARHSGDMLSKPGASQWALCATAQPCHPQAQPLFCTQTPGMGHWKPAG